MVALRVLWLNGTVGAGKTTIGATVAERLANKGEAVAFIDTDALGDLSPRPADDPFNTRLVAKNLSAVASNFADAGARTLIVAGVIQTEGDLELYERAVRAPITLVRLVVPPTELELRLHQRHGEIDPDGLRWHADRAPTLAAILDRSELRMLTVTNLGHPNDTARAVLAAAEWESRDAH